MDQQWILLLSSIFSSAPRSPPPFHSGQSSEKLIQFSSGQFSRSVVSALCIRWPKYWSFSFSIIPSKEIPGLISFRMDWLDLLAVQGTLKSLLQHHGSNASILRHSAFFTVQLSHPYMTTGKTIALTRQTLFGKVMSLLWNILSMLVAEQVERVLIWPPVSNPVTKLVSAGCSEFVHVHDFVVGSEQRFSFQKLLHRAVFPRFSF